MTTLKEAAKEYVPKQTLNIADLAKVDISLPFEDRTGIGQDGKEFTYSVLIQDDTEYRVPNSVLETLKSLLSVKDSIQFVKVVKQGTGLNTKYQVIVLD